MATWGDYTLRTLIDKLTGIIDDVLRVRPLVVFTSQPTDTSGDTVDFTLNIMGFVRRLQKLDNEQWVNVGPLATSSYTVAIQSLTAITETSVCRILVYPFGGSATNPTASAEFTVTRTATQTASMKQDMSGTVEKTDLEADSMDVVEDTPVKATTTTKK